MNITKIVSLLVPFIAYAAEKDLLLVPKTPNIFRFIKSLPLKYRDSVDKNVESFINGCDENKIEQAALGLYVSVEKYLAKPSCDSWNKISSAVGVDLLEKNVGVNIYYPIAPDMESLVTIEVIDIQSHTLMQRKAVSIKNIIQARTSCATGCSLE